MSDSKDVTHPETLNSSTPNTASHTNNASSDATVCEMKGI